MADVQAAIDLLESVSEGYTSKQLFEERRNCYAYTYDDIIIMPGHNNFGVNDGKFPQCCLTIKKPNHFFQLICPSVFGNKNFSKHQAEASSPFLSHGHRDGAQHGYWHGPPRSHRHHPLQHDCRR